MDIVINGESRTVAEGLSVGDLLHSLGIEGERVAVELDRAIVKREDWEGRSVGPGSRVEIVHFVGGG
jgi:sulfur carrier protein